MENVQTLLDNFHNKEKAIDHALWLNFKYRIANISFGVIDGTQSKFAVCEEATANEMGISFLDILPKDYVDIEYRKLDTLAMDRNPLPHWEKIQGLFSVADGEILRYLLALEIPLEKFIRHELAKRGYDENHRWCGFDNARDIWLK